MPHLHAAGRLCAYGIVVALTPYTLAGASDSPTPLVLEPIVVTGEKAGRSPFDTASSVVIHDAKELERSTGHNVADLLRETPNVLALGAGNTLPSIRGVDGSGPASGAQALVAGTRPRLNLVFDGRSLSYHELAFGPQSLWDIEQVEIFRGPQSLIQGRNAIAGAIVVASRQPSFAWERAAKIALGNQQTRQYAAMLSGPLIADQLAFRLSVDRQQRESYTDMVRYAPIGNPREITSTTARAKLLYRPLILPGLTTQLSLNHLDTRTPQGEHEPPKRTVAGGRFDPRRPVFETHSNTLTWDLDWDDGQALAFEHRLVYAEFDNHRRTAPKLPYADIKGWEISTEPLLHFRPNERFSALAGLRYHRHQQDEFVNLLGGADFSDTTETVAVYGEASIGLGRNLHLTLGLRGEREHHERQGDSPAIGIDFDEVYSALLPSLDLAWRPHADLALGARAARGYNAGGAGVTFGRPITSYSFDKESVWNYELYARGRLDEHLELSANLFYNDYQDMQLPHYLSRRAIIVRNADQVETYGAEFTARWQPIRQVEARLGLGLLHTEIGDFPGTGLNGHTLPRAPRVSGHSALVWHAPGGFEVSASLSYRGDYDSQLDNDPRGRIASQWLAGVGIARDLGYSRLNLYAHNLLDNNEPIFVFDNDRNTALLQQPLEIGMSLELRF